MPQPLSDRTTRNGKKVGRPRKEITAKQVEALAAMQASYAEMAAALDCSCEVLERRFSAAIKRGREQATMSLKRAQFRLALSGHPTMLIWLGKQYLGQKDRSELSTPPGQPFAMTSGNDDRLSILARRIADMASRLGAGGNSVSPNS